MSALRKPPPDRQTPGAYMRTCRERAGCSIGEAVRAITPKPWDRARAERDIRALEADKPGDYGRLVRALRDFAPYPFDFALFTLLAGATVDFDAGGGE